MDNRNPYLQDLSNVHNYDLMKDYLFYRLTSCRTALYFLT